MAITVISELAGQTAEGDQALQEQLGVVSNPPAGVVLRLAGPTKSGWRVISVWDSQEEFEAFRRDRLEPALQAAGRPIPNFEISALESIRIVKTPALTNSR